MSDKKRAAKNLKSRRPATANAAPQRANVAAQTARPSRYARQADQAPPASLDHPWDNLHPERIWPD